MQTHPVTSSRIASVGYDKNSHILEVCFHDGSCYQYIAVPERVFDVFLTVVSKGRYYDGVIKGKYLARKVAGPGR